MKKWMKNITIGLACVFILPIITILLELFTGRILLKSNVEENARAWIADKTSSEVTSFTVVNSRDYQDYYVLLSKCNKENTPYIQSYHKMSFLPLYRRFLYDRPTASREIAGVELRRYGRHMTELYIRPPYNEIFVLGAGNQMIPAPQNEIY